MRAALIALALCAPLAVSTGCQSSPELEAVRAELVEVDQKAKDAQAAGDLAHAAALRQLETDYRARLASEAADTGVRTGDAVMDALSRGDVLAALLALGSVGIIGRQRLKKLKADLEGDLAQLEARRDASRARQGMTPAATEPADMEALTAALSSLMKPKGEDA